MTTDSKTVTTPSKSTAKPKAARKRSTASSNSGGSSKAERVAESVRQAFNAEHGREIVPEGGYKDEDMPNYVDPKAGR